MLNFSDAFGPVSLSRFAANPTSAHLFRVQHEVMVRQMDAITFEANTQGAGSLAEAAERALNVANSMTALRSVIEAHQIMESGLMHKVLASDPRQRMVAEQFEREAGAVIAEIDKLLIVYGSPSAILDDQATFAEKCGAAFAKLKERFKSEERDLFPVFDRLTAGSLTERTAAPLPPMDIVELEGEGEDLESAEADGIQSAAFRDSHAFDAVEVTDAVSMLPTTSLWVPQDAGEVGAVEVEVAAGASDVVGQEASDESVTLTHQDVSPAVRQDFPALSLVSN